MTETRAPYRTKITPSETVEIRISGAPASVQTMATWLRAQGLDIQSESSDWPSRKEARVVLRYLVAKTKK